MSASSALRPRTPSQSLRTESAKSTPRRVQSWTHSLACRASMRQPSRLTACCRSGPAGGRPALARTGGRPGAIDASARRPFPRPYRPFIGPILKGTLRVELTRSQLSHERPLPARPEHSARPPERSQKWSRIVSRRANIDRLKRARKLFENHVVKTEQTDWRARHPPPARLTFHETGAWILCRRLAPESSRSLRPRVGCPWVGGKIDRIRPRATSCNVFLVSMLVSIDRLRVDI